ncbi:uncharacterized protein LOC131858383 [Cryptomeria japonica]|uniref:uncharacterized protein LOC131858383 n=1 Tax=Cryptomeria japonica TaxID=3369 RepID=UPI0027DA98BE|nr:uncharacterized protein LOC131858383 [Cryptomeria japonica]
MPLRLVSVEEPFAQWGLDFIGMINPPSSTRHKWILTATDYFTRLSKVIPLRNSSESEVLAFLEDLVCRYGSSKTVIVDNACAFTGSRITQFTLSRGSKYKMECQHHLRSTLWADRITPKQTLKNSPYKLVYGKDALFPMSLEIPTLQLLKSMELAENGPMAVRLVEIMELQEAREAAFTALQDKQEVVKIWFDSKKSSDLVFNLRDLVLKYNERAMKLGQYAKFDCLWEGPFCILVSGKQEEKEEKVEKGEKRKVHYIKNIFVFSLQNE